MTISSIFRPSVFSGLTCILAFGQSDPTSVVLSDRDRDALLSLPWKQFDQTPNSGWRLYMNPPRKEYLQAAKLIEAYLQQHKELTARQRALLHYHAVHLYIYRSVRGGEGDVKEAMPHLEAAVVAHGDEPPSADWNDLVSATKAFLLGDRHELLAVRQRLLALSPASIKFMKPPHSADDLLVHLGKPYGSWFERFDPPNKEPEPTVQAVTPPAAQESRLP